MRMLPLNLKYMQPMLDAALVYISYDVFSDLLTHTFMKYVAAVVQQ